MSLRGGIRDVEGIVETDPDRLVAIVGTKELAKKLIDMAKRLLASGPSPRGAVAKAKKKSTKRRDE